MARGWEFMWETVRNTEASSLQGLANIEDGQRFVRLSHCFLPGRSSEDTIEKIENMTPEEADATWM